MKKEEFSQCVQQGLTKFMDAMRVQEKEYPEGSWDNLSERDWWEAYTFWVEENGVNPK